MVAVFASFFTFIARCIASIKDSLRVSCLSKSGDVVSLKRIQKNYLGTFSKTELLRCTAWNFDQLIHIFCNLVHMKIF